MLDARLKSTSRPPPESLGGVRGRTAVEPGGSGAFYLTVLRTCQAIGSTATPYRYACLVLDWEVMLRRLPVNMPQLWGRTAGFAPRLNLLSIPLSGASGICIVCAKPSSPAIYLPLRVLLPSARPYQRRMRLRWLLGIIRSLSRSAQTIHTWPQRRWRALPCIVRPQQFKSHFFVPAGQTGGRT